MKQVTPDGAKVAETMRTRAMEVVIACDTRNPYVDQLAQSLSMSEKVERAEDSLYKFWSQPDDADILHIQWPEALYNWKSPEPWELARLANVLDEWSEQAKIVTTIHNYRPHRIDDYKQLYRLVYERSDGFVHLGAASREWLCDAYDFAAQRQHAIIPHGNYACFPSHVTSDVARDRLGFDGDDVVILCFGKIRHTEERDLLIDGFDRFGARKKKLLIAGRMPPLSRRTLRYWRLKYDPRFHMEEGWIPDEDVQLYLKSADIVVIPRQGELNSGNVALGFTFGRVVVGPDEGVIGEVLCEAENPVYEPGSPQSLSEALEEAVALQEQVAEQNRDYAQQQMGWSNVATLHLDFYESIKSYS